MRAYVIKTKKGYISACCWLETFYLNEARLFGTKHRAKPHLQNDQTVVPVEITLIERNKK